MPASRLLLAAAAMALLAAGCRREAITSYSIPAEKDPDMGLGPAAEASAASANGDAVPAGASAAPSTMPGASMANTAVPVDQGPALAWSAPADWKSRPAGPMRKATYLLPSGAGMGVELSITAFPGDVGGELENVNRWRGQVKLPPVDASGLDGVVTRWQQAGLQLTVVDFSDGAPGGQRILGAIVPYAGGTWFFKVMGPAETVGGDKAAFLAFLHTIHPAQP